MITILISTIKSRPALLASVLVSSMLLLAACGADSGEASDQPTVVATTSIWGDVVSQIVGDDAIVEVLIPEGTDAHDYQPTPQQVATLATADLVVANGLGLEEGLHAVLENAEADGANILEVAPEVDPIPLINHKDEVATHEDEDHEHGDLDPHVWFDPLRVAAAAEAIAAELTEIDDSVDWSTRAQTYREALVAADNQIEGILADVPVDQRKLVTNHEALGYLADRYGFEVVGVVIPGGSTLSDPSSADLAELVRIIEDEMVSAVFTETTETSALAEAVASEVGREIAVVELYTESLGDDPADTLTGMLVEDANRIANALG